MAISVNWNSGPFQNQMSYMEPGRPSITGGAGQSRLSGRLTQPFTRQPTVSGSLVGILDKVFGSGGLFGGTGAAGAGSAGGFNFLDASGNRIGGVGPSGQASTGLNVPPAWNPQIASSSRADLLGAAGTVPATSSPYAQGGVPTMADARPGQVDANRAAALRSQNALNLAGLAGQAGVDLATQQALASEMQGAQSLGNAMHGYGANEQLLGGDLANRHARTGLATLMKLYGLIGQGGVA